MKKLTLTIATFLLTGMLYAQDLAGSKQAENSLKAKYPTAHVDEWFEDEGMIGCFFEIEDKYGQAMFTPEGKFISSEFSISIDEVPQEVIDAAHNNYKGFDIIEATEILSEDGIQYSIYMYDEDGDEDKTVFFDKTGKILHVKSANEEG